MSKVDVLLGLQWGDEGKGKIVDVITPKYDVVARFQGGPNAGHTLEFNGRKHVLHTIPSGIFRDGIVNVVGNGVVIDPVIFKKEISGLNEQGLDVSDRLQISTRAHLILPSHRMLDAAAEAAKGTAKIGSTLKGIGPTYMDKTGRNGIRVGDIFEKDFEKKVDFLLEKHKQILDFHQFDYTELSSLLDTWMNSLDEIRKLKVINSEYEINHWLSQGRKILAEGAQGSLLDIDFGTYPFVTSSNTVCAGACTGLGIAPNKIGEVYGIFKAYSTRVGSGPFPTELLNETGEAIRAKGREFGSTTGRPRRCGWLDLPSLNYAIMINGVTQLLMMKADVLSGFETLQICTEYCVNGVNQAGIPFDMNTADINPVYQPVKGWMSDLTGITSEEFFPDELSQYIRFIEERTKTPISLVSLGPDRSQTVIR
ncbi:MAG: adenylosuccinate synthase [Bacteroidia bacterium]|nr:adenylosuccinate synthase [Bacteroidia bacterium]